MELRPPTRLDLRLLVPAAFAWMLMVVLLGLPVAGPGPCLAAVATAAGGGLVAAAIRRSGARERSRRVASIVALTTLVVMLVGSAAAAHLAIRSVGPMPELATKRAVVTLQGRVEEDPRALQPDPRRPEPGYAARLLVTEVVARGVRTSVRTPVLLLGDADLATLHWREEVRVTGRVAAAGSGERVVALVRVTGRAQRVEAAGLVAQVAEHSRSRLRQAVQPLPEDARGLVPALVIGDRSLTPPRLTDAMKATGMTHLTAVSGSNVSVILAAVVLLCGVLGVPRSRRPWVAGLALAAFVVLARPDPSVIRAATMGAVGLLGVLVSRRAAGPPALSAAVVILLCIDPWLARSHGFALSALATLGLLLFARPWGAALSRYLPRRARILGEAAAIPLAAQAMCAPVVVLLQGSVPLIGVLANLVAAPLVPPATIAGVLAALTSAVWLPAGMLCAWVAALPAAGIAEVAHRLAPVPFGTMPWPDGTPGALLLAALFLAGLLAAPWLAHQARRHPVIAVGLLVVAVSAVWPTPGGSMPADWEFAACDVGEGDATAVATGPGRAVLVDVGPDPEPVRACLDRLGVTDVDALFLTHYHADHVAALVGAVAGRRVHALYVSPLPDPADQAQAVTDWAAGAGLTPVVVQTGDRFRFGQVTARARWPSRIIHAGSMPNNAGITLEVTTAHLQLLLLADLEREAAAEVARDLRADPAPRPFDVVKVAHHGSANQAPNLVRLVAAPVAVISVGAQNGYGHPAGRTLDLLRDSGATILRTDRDGDIVLWGPRTPAEGVRVRRLRH
ncbi:MAG: ComEC/Rec2 family competence protein [Micrococcales bacterium]|nr:ComEC/Rec2 family competence protein [Micrococcales bacterium]